MWRYAVTRGMVVLVASVKFEISGPRTNGPEISNLTLAISPYRASSQSIPPHIEITLRNKVRMYRSLHRVRAQSI